VPCGIPDKSVTSLEKELQHPLQLAEVKKVVQSNFKKVFEVEWI
jgi:lipoate-protein ligase B